MAELFDILTYDYAKATDILNIPDTYVSLVSLTTPSRDAGVYEYGISLTYKLDTANRSAYLRFSTDGGATWTEFISEPKDKTDDSPHFYQFPKNLAGGILNFEIQAKKETAANLMDVSFADIWIKRVN